MDSDNWVVQNLQNALDTWNGKLAEIWQILTQSPETFKGGGIWKAIVRHPRSVAGSRLCPLSIIFCDWSGKDMRQLY